MNWDYRCVTMTVDYSSEKHLQIFGADGWELVAIVPIKGAVGSVAMFYFKRQIADQNK